MLKIRSIDIIEPKPVGGMRVVVARVNSSDGVYGLGEIGCAIGMGATAAREFIKDIAPTLIGMDPLETEVIWEKMYRSSFWGIGGGAVVCSAISAIDTALWDLKARYFGVPLYVLLGGRQRDKLRAYASQLQMGWGIGEFDAFAAPMSMAEACKRAIDEGYTAVKANILGMSEEHRRRHPLDTLCTLTSRVLDTAEARLAEMREAVGPKVDIILENHAITDANTAIQFSRMAEKYNVLFLEEPTTPLGPGNFRRIAENTSIPLATGERTYLRQGFLPLLESGALSVIQPDVGNCGGVTEFKKIADMAYCYDAGVQCHTCSGPISVAVALQCEAAIPNFIIHEHHQCNLTHSNIKLCKYDYQPVNGRFKVPDLPGLGQELSDFVLNDRENVRKVSIDGGKTMWNMAEIR